MRFPAPTWLLDLAGAWIFYSVLPGLPWPAPRFKRIARFAPWIGLVIGSIQSVVWIMFDMLGWPLVALAGLVVAMGLWLTGGLHWDGLMDTADGLAAGQERCLAAMDDSRVGAAGVQVLVVVILVQLACLIKLAWWAPLALAISAFWGRCAPLWAINHFPYLRSSNGTASFHCNYCKGLWDAVPALIIVLSACAVVVLSPLNASVQLRILMAIWSGLIPAFVMPHWLGQRLGGHTGDSYGASLVLTETFTLMILALVL